MSSSAPVNKSVNIFLESASAERAYERLTKQADRLTQAIDKGQKAGKDMTRELEQLSRANRALDTLQQQMSGKIAPSLMQVKARAQELRRELERMSADAPGYAKKLEEYGRVSRHFEEMRARIDAVGRTVRQVTDEGMTRWQRFWDTAKGVAVGTLVGNGVMAATQSIVGYFSGMLSGNARLSDELSDIRKAASLSADEVKRVNTELGKIDTRTTSNELREIAVGLGQIGQAITPENVENMDKIVVALGDEFGGGAREITTALGVLRNNLQDIKTGNYGEDVLHIGNALNVLGAEGLATAPVVVDMANRMAGVAGTFKLTSGQILGTAATFQELGISSERGTTAFNRILLKMTKDTATFAKVAGQSVKEFEELMNRDMLAALVAVAEGTKKAGGENVAFGKILSELNADGSGAGEVLSKLAANGELLAGKVQLATGALKESSSITEEFNIKNTNLAASLEKLEKQFYKMMTSSSVNNFLSGAVNVAGAMVQVLAGLTKFIGDNIVAFGLWTAAIILNTNAVRTLTWVKIQERLTTIANTVATTAEIIATTALGAAKALLTGNLVKLRQEWALLNATMGLNPLAGIAVLIGAVVMAVTMLTGKTRELNAEQRVALDLNKRLNDETMGLQVKLKLYSETAKNTALSDEARNTALKKMIELNPQVLEGITLNNIATKESTDRINEAIEAWKELAKQQVLTTMMSDAMRKKMEAEMQKDKAKKNLDWFSVGSFTASNPFAAGQYQSAQDAIKEADEDMKEIERLYQEVNQKIDKAQQETGNTAVVATRRTVGAIKAEIQALDDAYDNLDKEAALKNRQRRKQLEEELKTFDIASGGKAAERRANRALEEARAFQQKLEALRAELEASEEGTDERAIQRVKNKYATLREEAEKYFRTYGKRIAEAAQLDELQQKELDQLLRKQAEQRANKDYDAGLQKIRDYYQQQRQIAAKAYIDGEISRNQHAQRLEEIERGEVEDRSSLAQQFAADSTKAAKDLETAKTEALRKGVEDRKQLEDQTEKDKIALLERDILTSRPGSKAELDAQKALLEEKYRMAIENEELTNAEKERLTAQYNEDMYVLEMEFFRKKATEYIGYIQSIANIAQQYLSVANENDRASLEAYERNNEKKKNLLRRRLDDGIISQREYDKKVAELDEQAEKKRKELRLKEFRRNKAMGIINATIGTAQAVVNALGSGMPPFNFIMAALAGALGAVQIGIIANQKPPQYAKGRRPKGKGGVPDGPSHAGGGIDLVTPDGRVVGNMEGDEPILSRATYENNPELVDALLESSMYHGGKRITPNWFTTPMPQVRYGVATQAVEKATFYSNGGIAPPAHNSSSTMGSSQQAADNSELTDALQRLNQHLEKGIAAQMVWTEFDKMNKQMAAIRKSGSFNAAS